jgi:hypothetical protein
VRMARRTSRTIDSSHVDTALTSFYYAAGSRQVNDADDAYSDLSASMGSTDVARTAGT